MAGTVVTTEERNGTIKKITFDWLSDGAGAADATTTYAYDGQILSVLCIPDTGGTAPTDLYDVVLNDVDSRDMLFGQGANLSEVNSVAIQNNLGQITNDKLTLGVTNAGATNGGIVVVYVR